VTTGKPDIKDVIHLTFFARKVAPLGLPYYSFRRLIVRGNRVIYAR
jgi:hypothetical protein